MNKVKIIAEIGINHNGSVDECKKMIDLSKLAGCDYVKIQKRNPDVCVPEHQKSKPKSTPWGDMTYLEYKHKIEFNEEQIQELIKYSKSVGIELFASVWDIDSVDIMSKYTKVSKIGSASITDLNLCKAARGAFDFLIVSTGMSTESEIEKCVEVCNPDVIMHTNSTYPSPNQDLNLKYITWLKNKYSDKQIGYSGHEPGLLPTFTSVALGATWIERHITLDKNLWGSDQKASLNPDELFQLTRGIHEVSESIKYEPCPRLLFEDENLKRDSLRVKK